MVPYKFYLNIVVELTSSAIIKQSFLLWVKENSFDILECGFYIDLFLMDE